MKSAEVIESLNKFASKQKALNSARFFKTGEGQYGYGDIFIGVTVPEQRVVEKQFKDLPLTEIEILLKSPIHEHRSVALGILTLQFNKANKSKNEKLQDKIIKLYLKHRKHINNWDLVDSSAPYILGKYLYEKDSKDKKERDVLYKFTASKNLWERRIAIISTYYFIKQNDFKDTVKISELLLSDTHDLIHKAVGWMLREVGKKDEKVLKNFLNKHATYMPRTALRYAIEKMGKKERLYYMAKK